MEELSIYFSPVSENRIKKNAESLGRAIDAHVDDNFPEIKEKGVALIYCPEYRGVQEIKPKGTDAFRTVLYDLFPQFNWTFKVYDLGDLLPGETREDTVYALSNVVQELNKVDVVPIVVGGSQDLTFALYKAYEKLEQYVNLTTIDSKLDLGQADAEINANAWLSNIVMHQPSFLFNYSNLGCQAHFNAPSTLDLFEKLYFDIHRLGVLNANIKEAEPVLRNTDILSLDLTALRSSEFNSHAYSSPNGFFANEMCQLTRYAGISDKLTAFGIFNLFGDDKHKVVHELVAQAIWYFIDGYANRLGDFPKGSTKSYKKYKVFLEALDTEIVFYKSDKSNRWWINVPYPGEGSNKYIRHQMVPCSYEDYLAASKSEIPDLWYKTYQRLS